MWEGQPGANSNSARRPLCATAAGSSFTASIVSLCQRFVPRFDSRIIQYHALSV